MKRIINVIYPGSAQIASPRGLVVRAAELAAFFGVCHILGMREYTSVLCGMPPVAGGSRELYAFGGMIYILAYLSFVAVVPILLIAAGLLHWWTPRGAVPVAEEQADADDDEEASDKPPAG